MKTAILILTLFLAGTVSGVRGQEKQAAISDETQFPLIGNTAGFVYYNPGELRDTLNRIEFMNDDGSEWMSMHPDILNAPEHIRAGTDVINDGLNPWAFEPGIGVFTFRCVGQSDGGYAVIVNEEKNIVKHLKAHANLIFESLEEHVASVLVGTDFNLNPVRENPNDDAAPASTTDDELELIFATERRGEWIRIKDGYSNRELGWIRWKKGNRFMIRMYYSI